ncbi:YtxH domain-containing protein [Mucilaginibacter robiniae]|uniref:YtxH domain-containing protein n=1 Tax=Mucilaginibacter robiniae TaxID=2728022 RepID=A0A7L5E2R7_9SPHI|nr:YtxH domain-containing protein [Mucilaginibacter robiniae]QJD96629.1 YtxH domain-containing protein [Mucilaginibacter robiniae]
MKTKDLSELAKKIPSLKTSQSDTDAVKVIIALAAGVAAGAALGILFAPDKGTETRDKLSESLSNLSDTIKETAVAELDRLADLKGKVVDTIKTKINGAEQEYQDDLEHA